MGLTADDSLPLAAIVSRLTESKGWSLLDGIEEEMMNLGLQLVVLGQGEARYEDFFRRLAERYPGRAAVCIGFDETLARQIYAGADLFLMPSRSEPCGLAQLIAMRYGCLPVVRETGGLRDTVPPYRDDTGEGRGFTFFDYTPAELLGALKRAVAFYRDGARFPALQRRNMAGEYGWAAAAEAYLRLYERLLPA